MADLIGHLCYRFPVKPGMTVKVTMFVIQMKNALRGLSAPAAWQTPEKFFI